MWRGALLAETDLYLSIEEMLWLNVTNDSGGRAVEIDSKAIINGMMAGLSDRLKAPSIFVNVPSVHKVTRYFEWNKQ